LHSSCADFFALSLGGAPCEERHGVLCSSCIGGRQPLRLVSISMPFAHTHTLSLKPGRSHECRPLHMLKARGHEEATRRSDRGGNKRKPHLLKVLARVHEVTVRERKLKRPPLSVQRLQPGASPAYD